ncbi:hypothetical protein DdX_14350 [Ditylenchus destructor]|uniref:Uncharacterized protein n=1 Tax=Ditylenchus destructor TaxID=166010 RepID=A0AAD4MRC8_9BILA|nr:hypothetical protein DdX_14350 [Ditylenchus destructor]
MFLFLEPSRWQPWITVCSIGRSQPRTDTGFLVKDYYPYLDYVACARHFLGIDTRIFGSHIKLIQRGNAWVRDGNNKVTSRWSSRDFMFHGWKESENDWIRPFIKEDAFQLNSCWLGRNRTQEAIFTENWQYNRTLNETDVGIETIIDSERNKSIRGYEKALKKIKKF